MNYGSFTLCFIQNDWWLSFRINDIEDNTETVSISTSNASNNLHNSNKPISYTIIWWNYIKISIPRRIPDSKAPPDIVLPLK